MVFAEGSAGFLGDFPESRCTTAFPEAGCGREFTVLLAFLVFAYREQEDQAHLAWQYAQKAQLL
jgi:hypothetical protein